MSVGCPRQATFPAASARIVSGSDAASTERTRPSRSCTSSKLVQPRAAAWLAEVVALSSSLTATIATLPRQSARFFASDSNLAIAGWQGAQLADQNSSTRMEPFAASERQDSL